MTTNILRNYLADHGFIDLETILEDKVPRRAIIAYRMRRLGLPAVMGQIAFMGLVEPVMRKASRGRFAELRDQYGLRTDQPQDRETSVTNVNSVSVVRFLQERQPDAVIVNGTRIIREHILNAVNCPFINIHAGITPQYRGVHGGYWALQQGDKQNFGVTIHLVDKGVDTGSVLAQVRTCPSANDNFSTYPLLQQALALGPLVQILKGISCGHAVVPTVIQAETRQWFHPTLFEYAAGRLRGVK